MSVSSTPLEGDKLEKLLSLLKNGHNAPRSRYGTNRCVLTAHYSKSAQEIKDLEVREDDVWVVTAPKCGTTWMQELAWLLIHDLDYEGARKRLWDRSPFLEMGRMMDGKPDDFEGPPRRDPLAVVAELTPPRLIKSHLHKDLLPAQIWTKKPKVIYVAREPKDAAVSYYHHCKLLSGYGGSQEYFFECFLEDLVFFAPYWEHTLDFWKIKDEQHILFVTFEEMKKDLSSVIRRAARFLGKTINDEQVARLAEHLDIKNMKMNPAVNDEDMLAKRRAKGEISDDQAFIRKGVVGEGRREMSLEMAAKFDERTRRVYSAAGGCPWDHRARDFDAQ